MMTHLGLHRIASATIGSISEMVRQHECCAYIKQEQFVWSTPIYARIFGKTDAQVRGVPYRSIMCQGTWDQRKRYLSKAMHGQSCHVYVMHHCTGDMLLESYVPNFTTTGTLDGVYVMASRCKESGTTTSSSSKSGASMLLQITRASERP